MEQKTYYRLRCIKDGPCCTAGHTYWCGESDHIGHCWHIFVNPDGNDWLFNVFSEEELNEYFERVEG